jgi:hypothetical protein
MNIKDLLAKGYFPKELPPPFHTQTYATFIHDKISVINNEFISNPAIHNLARPGNQRRVLSIPHPLNYFNLSKLIADNWLTIQEHCNKSKLSISTPIIDTKGFRSIQPKFDGGSLPKNRSAIRSMSKYVLRIDISRFYPSIYSHSIPWALSTKAIAKRVRRGGFANDLDLLLRNSQDAQTLGIPVGPDISFIVAEIVATSVDVILQQYNLKGFRFIDDFEFVFYSRSEAEQALPKIESALQEFELALNPNKTFIDELPINIDKPWTSQIKNFDFGMHPNASKFFQYFDLLFLLYNDNRKEPILSYGISRLDSLDSFDPVLGDLLLQCINIEPGTLTEVLQLCDIHEISIDDENFKIVLFNMIEYHGAMKHGSEVAWALWTCIFKKYKIPEKYVESIMHFEDNIVALLGCHACSLKLLSEKALEHWKSLMTVDSLKNRNWLLAYEADIKGWLPSIDISNHVNSDPFFYLLKQNNVSFYNTGVSKIVLDKNVNDPYKNKQNKIIFINANDYNDDLPF